MGLYMVWPAFYTDVTDSYRLPRRDRLRVDLGGIYFNADRRRRHARASGSPGTSTRCCCSIALQLLMMVKNLSPVIRVGRLPHPRRRDRRPRPLRAHRADAARLLPGHRREPSALTGRARLLVTVWVLVVVPVLLSLMLGAVLLLPRLLTTAWDSGRAIGAGDPARGRHGDVLALRLVSPARARCLPVVGSVLDRAAASLQASSARRARWSARPPGRAACSSSPRPRRSPRRGLGVVARRPVPAGARRRARHARQLRARRRLAAAAARPGRAAGARPRCAPGTHLAVAMIPVGGATKRAPGALRHRGQATASPPVAILSARSPDPPSPPAARPATTPRRRPTTAAPAARRADAAPRSRRPRSRSSCPSAPGPGGPQAVAVNTTRTAASTTTSPTPSSPCVTARR